MVYETVSAGVQAHFESLASFTSSISVFFDWEGGEGGESECPRLDEKALCGEEG